jgi:transposase
MRDKMSKHTVVGGDGRELLNLLARLKTRVEQRIAAPVKVVAIHEVGLDGFWTHHLLDANGVESHVVDPAASIAVPRRHRRAKTDAIDGETLLRTLMAWRRGEPRVCAMTVPPSPSEEDCRRISRERERCCGSAFDIQTAFEDCCSARGSPTTTRRIRTAGSVWKSADRRRTLGASSPQG